MTCVINAVNGSTYKASDVVFPSQSDRKRSQRGERIDTKMSKMQTLFTKADQYFIGGSSAGQRYNSVLGQPLYVARADGSHVFDVDGKEYIDYHTGAGAALFGRNHPRIREAIGRAMDMGFFMNFDTEHHARLAELLQMVFPSCERIRLANTGSEATQAAIRVARSHTGRDKVLRFEGHFHGMHENIWFNHNMVADMDGHGEVRTIPDSQGFPANATDSVINVVFNDAAALEHALEKYKGQIACVILEPISYNCGCYEARKNYLQKVRELCSREDIVLIFDEVICGLRMRPGSAQKYYGVIPDMTTMAKAIAGGMPIAAFGGRKEIMERLNPVGKTMVSGTYSGALMPVMASIECLTMALEPGFYDRIEATGNKLFSGVNDLFAKHGIAGHARGVGARFAFYFGVDNAEDDFDFRKIASEQNRDMYKKFVTGCLPRGLWFHDTAGPVSPAHYGFTVTHTERDIDTTLERLDDIFKTLK